MPNNIRSRIVLCWRQEMVTRMTPYTISSMAIARRATFGGTTRGARRTSTGSRTTVTPMTGLRFVATHFIFSPALVGEFFFNCSCCNCLKICPFQPPSILPISSRGKDRAIYFLLSSDLVSQSTKSNILSVSVFLIANLTQGCFSPLPK